MSKKCHYCGGNAEFIGKNWDNEDVFRCKKCGKQGRDNCFSDRPTVFHRITTSPEVLAPKFVYHVTSFLDGLDKPKKIWYSTLINNQYFNTELEAKRATVSKLKEVAE